MSLSGMERGGEIAKEVLGIETFKSTISLLTSNLKSISHTDCSHFAIKNIPTSTKQKMKMK